MFRRQYHKGAIIVLCLPARGRCVSRSYIASCLLFASWLLYGGGNSIFVSILQSLKNESCERLFDIWGDAFIPELMSDGAILVCGQSEKRFFAAQDRSEERRVGKEGR